MNGNVIYVDRIQQVAALGSVLRNVHITDNV